MLQYPKQTITDGIQTVTYEQLLSDAEQIGKSLKHEKYGLLFESDFDVAKALLACLFAGKTAVLLSKKYGEAHTKRIIDTIHISHVISENGIHEIKETEDEKEDLSDVALIMCTSGTTGYPKGAMITNENLVTNLIDISKYFGITSSDHILIARPLYHCAVLTGEFLISLIKGLKITFISNGFVPVEILKIAKEQHITVLCGTPTLFYHLSKLNLKSKNPLYLNTIAISGECMTKIVADVIQRAFCGAKIYNVYGLTEASPRVAYLPPEEFASHPLSVGYPLSSLTATIKESELLVSGKSIMKGYYNDPIATKRVKRDGWLHTGDIAEMDERGRICIKCRKDNMIIRAGMNIYPQEIENALKMDPAVIDVLAYGEKKTTVSEEIHIRIVTELRKSEVYDICKRLLPSYELPDVIEIVDEIPKNASGKVIRNVPKG